MNSNKTLWKNIITMNIIIIRLNKIIMFLQFKKGYVYSLPFITTLLAIPFKEKDYLMKKKKMIQAARIIGSKNPALPLIFISSRVYIHKWQYKYMYLNMPQLIPFFFLNQVVFNFLLLVLIVYMFTKYILPKFVRLFLFRLHIIGL